MSDKVKTESNMLEEMVDAVLAGSPSSFRNSLYQLMETRVDKLVNKEMLRVASAVFHESTITEEKLSLKEERDSNEYMYDTVVVRDVDTFEREKNHMPEWMQEATTNGLEIEPIRERDAIDLSDKFHSIEFTTGA